MGAFLSQRTHCTTRERTTLIFIITSHGQMVEEGVLKLVRIDTKDQPADIMTKPLDVTRFWYLMSLLGMSVPKAAQ